MPQSLSKITAHLVFSTKDRVAYLESGLAPKMHAYLAGTLRELNCPVLEVGGVVDHVHILFTLSRTLSVADTVSKLKANSSRWIKSECPDFAWQAGYGIFSVGQDGLEAAVRYVKTQEEHHRTRTYKEEFLALLTEHGLEWDERYVWQ